jgi:hypothetical protein
MLPPRCGAVDIMLTAFLLGALRFGFGLIVGRQLGGGLLERNGAEPDTFNLGRGDEGQYMLLETLLEGLR